MDKNIRNRINELEKIAKIETDAELINQIYQFKKRRGEIGKIPEHIYRENNKGTFSKCFNGERKFRFEDYLAIEYVLNTSMAYIIEGKGEAPENFELKGIRYAAYTDTIGNYEKLMLDNVLNESDEYNKMLIDYMIEYKSKNGFKYFAERDLLPLGKTGGYNRSLNCLYCSGTDRKKLLKVLCELLPANLLIQYFDGFLDYNEIACSQINEDQYISFTDEVIAEAIKIKDLRKELYVSKKINLDSYNSGALRKDGQSYGDGLFVSYVLNVMIKYSLSHDVDDNIRVELIENAIKVNEECFKSTSTFAKQDIQIDKNGFLKNQHSDLFYGSVAIPFEASVEMSDHAKELLEQLNRQVHNFHEYISGNSMVSIYDNVILADKKDNQDYYRFFKVMNDKGVEIIPLLKDNKSKDKDVFEVSNGGKSRISNGAEGDIFEIIKAIKRLDDISVKELNGQTYYLVNPSIYMYGDTVNYIMPRDVVATNKYSNLVRFINDDAKWILHEIRNVTKIKQFVKLLKAYGIVKDEIDQFIDDFIVLSEEQAEFIDKTSEKGKALALITLQNKAWINIYREDIAKEF